MKTPPQLQLLTAAALASALCSKAQADFASNPSIPASEKSGATRVYLKAAFAGAGLFARPRRAA